MLYGNSNRFAQLTYYVCVRSVCYLSLTELTFYVPKQIGVINRQRVCMLYEPTLSVFLCTE